MTTKQLIGQQGEAVAMQYLQSQGYKLYAKNVQIGRSEVDIIMYDPLDKVMVFVEVKARSRETEYHPLLNWTPRKRRALMRGATQWAAAHAYDKGFRLDLVCVVGGRVVEHIKEINGE